MAQDTPQTETDDVDVQPTQTVTAGGADANADVPQLSYEAARDELVDIVSRLENGQVGLEDSMGLWQRGEALAAHCAKWLDDAEAKLSD
ncbi:exodeoxyribonuclease VII small subunit [Knoellia aerolata]|uniref:Exodeoxyribonuclease VII small subunit n=1 Tax=Knoellia aerolata DSM 18566 TaxID=1385519 RepID=A0A0A0K495_9MICO|nr:exodeoxyribonuclease VII small subunit [Knoellia aerolata]KGN43087.1 exodeoxyribonuclease VII small subunit [Knoellia aerolata DSM 18566]